MKERMTISSRFHDQTDMCVTIMKDTNFAFQSRVAVFALPCLQLQRLCIIAEEKPDSYDEEIYVWMNKVMAVVNNRHHESVFMIATVHPGSLPRHADGKIDIHEVSARLEKGTLHPSHVICCPHSAIHDLPRSKDRMLGMGPNSIMQGFVVAGASPAQITENPLQEEIEAFIHQQLITRASDEESARKHLIFSNPILPGADYVRMSPLVLHNKAQKMIKHLKSHGAQPRDKVLVSLRSTHLVVGLYACLMMGTIPIPCRPPMENSSFTAMLIAKESKAKFVLTSSTSAKVSLDVNVLKFERYQ